MNRMTTEKRCPRCGKPCLKIDWEKKKAKCTECGFEEHFMLQK